MSERQRQSEPESTLGSFPSATVSSSTSSSARPLRRWATRNTRWRAAAFFLPSAMTWPSVNTRLSTVTLDFTRAVMTTQVVHVTIDDYASTISLIVPEEATVDLNGVETVGGSATNKVRTGPPIGPLHVVVRGKVRFGNVTAKHPFGTSIRRMFG